MTRHRQTVGRTFLAAMSLLGIVALVQIGALGWQLFHPAKEKPAPSAAATAPPPLQATAKAEPKADPAALPSPTPLAGAASSPGAEQAAAEAEKQLIARQAEKELIASLPKPTPLPLRHETVQEARISGLVNLARALRERGDTGTALTRLREAQTISPENPQVISEMAMTYEKMGLAGKATEQWRRIYTIGEKAGIYYAAAEAKLRVPPPATNGSASAPHAAAGEADPEENPLLAAAAPREPLLSLGKVETVEDNGESQPLRQLKVRIPIQARPGARIDVRDVVIQVYFYDQLKNESVVETNADVRSSWVRRIAPNGTELAVDWKSTDPEVLEVGYDQEDSAPPATGSRARGAKNHPKNRQNAAGRKYFGYAVRVYYKGDLNASFATPENLLTLFPPPAALPSPDLPQ